MTKAEAKPTRSELMARIRATGNGSTEQRVETALTASGISGWEKHPKDCQGRPDFLFRDCRLVIFVDGCYWHGCPKHGHVPKSNSVYWRPKIEQTRRRDARNRGRLRASGFHVMRIWEHEVSTGTWLKRLRTMIRRIEVAPA